MQPHAKTWYTASLETVTESIDTMQEFDEIHAARTKSAGRVACLKSVRSSASYSGITSIS